MSTSPPPPSPAPSLPRPVVVLLSGAAFVIVVAGTRAAAGIVGPLMLALVLTITFHPLQLWLQQRRVPAWLASVIVLISVYLLLVALILAMAVSIGRLASLVPTYADNINSTVADAGGWLADRGVGQRQVNAVVDAIDPGRLVGAATAIMGSVLGVLSDLFFVVTLLLFLAFDASVVPRLAGPVAERRPHLMEGITAFARGTRSYITVSAVFGLIVAVIDVLALLVLGVPAAFVWGVLAFVTNFIPNIGFVIGVVPPAVIGLLEGGPDLMIAVIAVYGVVNFVVQSLIQPRIVGNAVGLTGTLTFLSLVFWAWVLGALGALLAVPMSLLVRAVLVDADPDAHWLRPLLSGRPEAEPDRAPPPEPDAEPDAGPGPGPEPRSADLDDPDLPPDTLLA